jgi:AcrR family transcriptional regulator
MRATSVPAFTRLNPEGRRRQIVDAARTVFSEKPYDSVSMNDIARAAGVTRGLIHHYFGGKTQLFGAVVESLADRAPSQVSTGPEIPLDDVIAVGVDAWLDFVAEHRELALTIGAGMHPDDPALQTIVETAREAIVDRIIPNLRVGEETDVRFLIRSYLGLADAGSREWLYYGRATRDEVHSMLTRSLAELVRATPPPHGTGSSAG